LRSFTVSKIYFPTPWFFIRNPTNHFSPLSLQRSLHNFCTFPNSFLLFWTLSRPFHRKLKELCLVHYHPSIMGKICEIELWIFIFLTEWNGWEFWRIYGFSEKGSSLCLVTCNVYSCLIEFEAFFVLGKFMQFVLRQPWFFKLENSKWRIVIIHTCYALNYRQGETINIT
jgi:hypothetical protein